MKLGFKELAQVLVRLPLTERTSYGIHGASYEHADAIMISTVMTTLVNAGAYPGPSAVYNVHDNVSLTFLSALSELCDEGWVDQVTETRYRLSEEGYCALRQSRIVGNATRVLKPREETPLADRTHHEMLSGLEAAGWMIMPYPRKQLAAIQTKDVPDDHKICYFHGSALDVCKPYLEVFLSLDAIAARGDLFLLIQFTATRELCESYVHI